MPEVSHKSEQRQGAHTGAQKATPHGWDTCGVGGCISRVLMQPCPPAPRRDLRRVTDNLDGRAAGQRSNVRGRALRGGRGGVRAREDEERRARFGQLCVRGGQKPYSSLSTSSAALENTVAERARWRDGARTARSEEHRRTGQGPAWEAERERA